MPNLFFMTILVYGKNNFQDTKKENNFYFKNDKIYVYKIYLFLIFNFYIFNF
jgi:hypothetical protein